MAKKELRKHLPLTLSKDSVNEKEHKFSGVALTLGKPNNSHQIQFNINCFKPGTTKKTLLFHHRNGLDSIIGHVFLTYEKDSAKVTFEAVLNMDLESAQKVWAMLDHGDLDCVSIGVDLIEYERHTEGEYKDWYYEAKKAEIYELSVVVAGSDPKAKIKKVFSLEEFTELDLQEETASEAESEDAQAEDNTQKEMQKTPLEETPQVEKKKEVAEMSNEETKKTLSKNDLGTLRGIRAERAEQQEAIELKKATLAKRREQTTALMEDTDEATMTRRKAELNKMDAEIKAMIEEDQKLEVLETKLAKQRDEFVAELGLIDPNKVDEKAELSIKKAHFAKMWRDKGYAFAAANVDDITLSEFSKDIIEKAFTHGGVLARSSKKYDSVKETKYKVYTSGRESNKGEYNESTNTSGTSATVEVITMRLGRYSTFVDIDHDIRSGSEEDFYPWLVSEMANILQEDLEADQVSAAAAVTSSGEASGVYGINSQLFVDKGLTTRMEYNSAKPISSNVLALAAKVKNKDKVKLDVLINPDDYYAMIEEDMSRVNAPLYSGTMGDFNFIPSPHVKSVTDATATTDDIKLGVGILPNYTYGFENQALKFGETPQDKDLNSQVYGHAFASGMCTKSESFAVATGSVPAPGTLGVTINSASVTVGSTSVTGTCTEGATVTVAVNAGTAITATVTGTTWSATVTALVLGDTVTATATLNGETVNANPVTVAAVALMGGSDLNKAREEAEAAKAEVEAMREELALAKEEAEAAKAEASSAKGLATKAKNELEKLRNKQ